MASDNIKQLLKMLIEYRKCICFSIANANIVFANATTAFFNVVAEVTL